MQRGERTVRPAETGVSSDKRGQSHFSGCPAGLPAEDPGKVTLTRFSDSRITCRQRLRWEPAAKSRSPPMHLIQPVLPLRDSDGQALPTSISGEVRTALVRRA